MLGLCHVLDLIFYVFRESKLKILNKDEAWIHIRRIRFNPPADTNQFGAFWNKSDVQKSILNLSILKDLIPFVLFHKSADVLSSLSYKV